MSDNKFSSLVQSHPKPVSVFTLGISVVRTILMTLTYENPYLWSKLCGRKNERADMEGPYYILGAPSREIEPGRGILANSDLLKKFGPYLMTVRVLSADGKPLSGVTLDWWQASTIGEYYFKNYTLRGRVTTDANGYAEVLTVVPGAYGVGSALRAGHFHLHFWPSSVKDSTTEESHEDLVTQMYVCEANDPTPMEEDFLNSWRSMNRDRMMHSWSLPSKTFDDGRALRNFPELPDNDTQTRERVDWWNSKLAQNIDPEMTVVGGASTELRLTLKGAKH